jgi:MFS family permease
MSKVMLFYSVGLVGGAPIGGALYQRFGYKAPFILCVVLAGIDFFLRLFMVEKDECLSEWFSDSSKKKQIEDQQSIVVVEQGEKTVASMEGNFTGEQASQSSITQSQNDINNDTDTQVVMPQQKLSTWTLLRQPRLLAAALLSFANGTIFNVFEVCLIIYS